MFNPSDWDVLCGTLALFFLAVYIFDVRDANALTLHSTLQIPGSPSYCRTARAAYRHRQAAAVSLLALGIMVIVWLAGPEFLCGVNRFLESGYQPPPTNSAPLEYSGSALHRSCESRVI